MQLPNQADLDQLRAQQKRLQQEVAELSQRINELTLKVLAQPAEAVPPSLPSTISQSSLPASPQTEKQEPEPTPRPGSLPPPIPPIISEVARPLVQPREGVLAQSAASSQESPVSGSPGEPLLENLLASQSARLTSPSAPPAVFGTDQEPNMAAELATVGEKPAKNGSIEMRFGTHWAPRIGIVLVLTAMVFFANYAYQNYIAQLGPMGKISLMYVGSLLLLGAGGWWQRKAAKPALKNYAQVLFAGGMAAVYFTTYVAHHMEPLRVIQSATLDGLLLLGWAGFMVWIADRKQSEVLAMFGLGLAYYTSVMTRVGSFTLYSNLVLTVAAVFFLIRNRWAGLSFASLIASYAAYAFWRFWNGESWHWVSPEEGLWNGTYFLISYWLVFTAAVFLSKKDQFEPKTRATFLSLNNGAFFLLFLLTMLQVRQGGFWKFSLIFGSTLIGLAAAARYYLKDEPLAKQFYLTQGLLLVTVGLIAKFSGVKLGMMLAAESVFLLFAGHKFGNRIMRAGAYACGLLAMIYVVDGSERFDSPTMWMGIGVGSLMLVNMLLSHRRELVDLGTGNARPRTAYFSLLSLIVWLIVLWNNSPTPMLPLLLVAAGIVMALSVYVLEVPELSYLSQVYVVLGLAAWLLRWLEDSAQLPGWSTPVLLVMVTGLMHWWQHQDRLRLPQANQVLQAGYALAITGVLYLWQSKALPLNQQMALAAGLALGLTLYGVITRGWWLAATAQLLLPLTLMFFVSDVQDGIEWRYSLAPILVVVLLASGTRAWLGRRPEGSAQLREGLQIAATAYFWVALAMSIAWVCHFIPVRERIWVLCLLGVGLFGLAGWIKSAQALLFSGICAAAGLAIFALPMFGEGKVYLPNLFAILAVLVQAQTMKLLPGRFGAPLVAYQGTVVAGGLALWLMLSRWVLESQSGFYLTVSWSLLALAFFAAGIVLKERMYRWLGLAILAFALGRVVLFDVWKLKTLFRIFSFMALGVVLLILGFVYNKYQEKIRQWL